MSYRLSACAEQDLDEIWSYVAEDASPETADGSLTPSLSDSSCWPSSPGWVAYGRSSERAFDHSLSRITSSTTDTRGKSLSAESCMAGAIKPRLGRSQAEILYGARSGRRPANADRAQTGPNRRRKSPRSDWNTDDLCSAERAKSLRSASSPSRPGEASGSRALVPSCRSLSRRLFVAWLVRSFQFIEAH